MAGLYSGFTPDSPHTTQLLREFMTVIHDFATLAKNPNALQAMLKDSIALTDSEQKKVEAAIQYLEKEQDLRKELTEKHTDAMRRHAEATDMLEKAKQTQAANTALASSLNKNAEAHKFKDKEHAEKDAAHDKRHAELVSREAKLNSKEQDLLAREKIVADKEVNLRQRAERLRRETEGL